MSVYRLTPQPVEPLTPEKLAATHARIKREEKLAIITSCTPEAARAIAVRCLEAAEGYFRLALLAAERAEEIGARLRQQGGTR